MKRLFIVMMIFSLNYILVAQDNQIVEKSIGFGFTGYVVKSLKNGKPEYKFRIVIDENKRIIESDWNSGGSSPSLKWLGDGWLGFFGGSKTAPDCYAIIYDGNTKRLSKAIYLYKVIDVKSELALIVTDNQISVIKLFDTIKMIVPPPFDLYYTVSYWNSIRDDSKFTSDSLILSYVDNYDFDTDFISEKLLKIKLESYLQDKK